MANSKNILFPIFTLFCFIGMIAQEITGTYKVIDQTLAVGDIGSGYVFGKNGQFQNITYEHLEQRSISGGVYRRAGDTLILEYKAQGTNPESEIILIDKKDLNDPEKLFSNIRVFNEENKPQPGVNILVQNNEKKIVTGFMSDKDGRFPQLSFYDKYIKYFTISWISSREISIPADSLFGYSTDIEVYLKDSTVTYDNHPDKIIKFLITRRNEEVLELWNLNGKPDKGIILHKL